MVTCSQGGKSPWTLRVLPGDRIKAFVMCGLWKQSSLRKEKLVLGSVGSNPERKTFLVLVMVIKPRFCTIEISSLL
jgi:hypothetical protein